MGGLSGSLRRIEIDLDRFNRWNVDCSTRRGCFPIIKEKYDQLIELVGFQ